MTDLDQLLDKAGADAQKSVRTISTPSAATIQRRARRDRITVTAAGVALIGGLGVSLILLGSGSDGPVASNNDALITSEMILEDGVVTEEEYRAGAQAVVSCLRDAGFDAEVSFDDPVDTSGFEGHATFSAWGTEEQLEKCSDAHLSYNVSLGWAVELGQMDIEELRAKETILVTCVEERTGENFGELVYNEFGYLTEQGLQTKDAAFEYQDHEPWGECRVEELGLEPWPDPDEFREHEDLEPTSSAGKEIMQRDGLTLTIRGRLDSPCIEVRSDRGMAGGCGADFSQLLQFGVGGIDGVSFVNGWAPQSSAKVVVTLADGTTIEVTELVALEGFDVLFFLELLPPTTNGEPELPITATAFDQTGAITAEFVLSEPDAP